MKRLGILAALLGSIAMSSAFAAECQRQPGKGSGHWTYRLIDQKRCWYRGHRHLPRAQLHWPKSDEPKKLPDPPARAQAPYPARAEGETAAVAASSIWDCCGLPPSPSLVLPVEPFDARWADTAFRLYQWNQRNLVP